MKALLCSTGKRNGGLSRPTPAHTRQKSAKESLIGRAGSLLHHQNTGASQKWGAFSFVAFVTGQGVVGLFKYSLLFLLTASVIAAFCKFGRPIRAKLVRWLLWALGAICAVAGVIAVFRADSEPLAFAAGFVLWVFAAYSIKIAESLSNRG